MGDVSLKSLIRSFYAAKFYMPTVSPNQFTFSKELAPQLPDKKTSLENNFQVVKLARVYGSNMKILVKEICLFTRAM